MPADSETLASQKHL